MNFNSIFQLFLLLVLGYLIFSRKQFNIPDKPLSRKAKVVLGCLVCILFVINVIYFSWIYYKSNNPNYRYDEISTQVSRHIYKPAVLPDGRVQNWAFHIWDEEFAGSRNAVRTAYAYPIMKTLEQESESGIIIFTQGKVGEEFDLVSYASEQWKDSNRELERREVKINSELIKQGYMLKNDFRTMLLALTHDNVLLSFIAVQTPVEPLIEMAESVE